MLPPTYASKTGTIEPEDPAAYFHERLHRWGAEHMRAFPWRSTTDPYQVLIAEMMLRRTQARQVVPVYHRFLTQYPTVHHLVRAQQADIEVLLRPLGLAWRVANIIDLARQIVSRHNGRIPAERASLLALAGVGDYVASAVRCLAFAAPETLVDTNTVRVAGRYFGFVTDAESRRKRGVREAVGALIDPAAPRDANLTLLDFAALICRATRPLCARCPVAQKCSWYREHVCDHGSTPGENNAANT